LNSVLSINIKNTASKNKYSLNRLKTIFKPTQHLVIDITGVKHCLNNSWPQSSYQAALQNTYAEIPLGLLRYARKSRDVTCHDVRVGLISQHAHRQSIIFLRKFRFDLDFVHSELRR